MTNADLEREVRAIIRKRVDRGQTAPASWITQEVIQAYWSTETTTPLLNDLHLEFASLCIYEHVRTMVRKCVQKYKEVPSVEVDQQLLLGDEFKRLQKAYLVERKKEQIVVPINLLTDDEIQEKVAELYKMGEGCYEHAAELSRYSRRRAA